MSDPITETTVLNQPVHESRDEEKPRDHSPTKLWDLVLPGLKESPVQQYRVSQTGVLVMDQATQTATSLPSVVRAVRAASTAARPARVPDPATAAIARWAKLLVLLLQAQH